MSRNKSKNSRDPHFEIRKDGSKVFVKDSGRTRLAGAVDVEQKNKETDVHVYGTFQDSYAWRLLSGNACKLYLEMSRSEYTQGLNKNLNRSKFEFFFPAGTYRRKGYTRSTFIRLRNELVVLGFIDMPYNHTRTFSKNDGTKYRVGDGDMVIYRISSRWQYVTPENPIAPEFVPDRPTGGVSLEMEIADKAYQQRQETLEESVI